MYSQLNFIESKLRTMEEFCFTLIKLERLLRNYEKDEEK
jgi:hypothetical protein